MNTIVNSIFLAGTTDPGAGGLIGMVLWLGIFFAIFYFVLIRPQKKQEKEHALLVESAEVGDSVLTSSGFYGILIDVTDEIVIVEFGNNKNCRIPMKKSSIVQLEKPGQAKEEAKETKEVEDKKTRRKK